MITDGSCGADLERFGKEVEKGGKDWKREKSYFAVKEQKKQTSSCCVYNLQDLSISIDLVHVPQFEHINLPIKQANK